MRFGTQNLRGFRDKAKMQEVRCNMTDGSEARGIQDGYQDSQKHHQTLLRHKEQSQGQRAHAPIAPTAQTTISNRQDETNN